MTNSEPMRPDPDRLLAQANKARRGKLKVFFGACAGVGKTYAMLQEAHRLKAQGLDVVAGIIETHGRSETAALQSGLEALPLKRVKLHHGGSVNEFDLDAALARRPAIVLIDELAHSNARGCRHPKRWNDVEELLDAGIDVFTTLNVQHLESLNDVVGGITGIRVRETVPDRVFDDATDVILVDIPPDDLRQRLNEGKVYIASQAERAIEHFFRKGNLIALREMALRRTADRVDEQMLAFRREADADRVWHTHDALLLCIGRHSGNDKLVRAAARLAAKLGCGWHAVYVETPRLHRLPKSQRRAILSSLKLAQELGAETATLSDPCEEKAVLRYAREHNLGKIVIGRRNERRWRLRSSFADRLGKLGPDLDLIVIAVEDAPFADGARESAPRLPSENRGQEIKGVALSLAICGLVTLLALWQLPLFDQANIVMIYLLGVVVIAFFYGRWPSVFATVINVASFDYFFVMPRWSFSVSDVQYLITFAVMLSVGLLIGNLTAGMRYQAKVARLRERRARHLYEMSKALNQALSVEEIARGCDDFIRNSFNAKSALLLPDADGELREVSTPRRRPFNVDSAISRWCFDKKTPAGLGTDTLPSVPYQLHPLVSRDRTFGVLAIEPQSLHQLMVPEQQRLLQTYTLLISNALERLLLSQTAEKTKLEMEREQLRNALLSALSHDLRTPLTALQGQTEMLSQRLKKEKHAEYPQVEGIHQYVLNTARLVNNLLDMARIQSGGMSPRCEWQSLEEIVGSVLHTFDAALPGRNVKIALPEALPLLYCDPALIARVFLNLLENAVKYAGEQASVMIKAQERDDAIYVEVADDGPGIPQGQEKTIFDKFSRGNKESPVHGIGLGLAICQAIISLHGGEIWAENAPSGGARFCFTLPLDVQPEITLDEDE